MTTEDKTLARTVSVIVARRAGCKEVPLNNFLFGSVTALKEIIYNQLKGCNVIIDAYPLNQLDAIGLRSALGATLASRDKSSYINKSIPALIAEACLINKGWSDDVADDSKSKVYILASEESAKEYRLIADEIILFDLFTEDDNNKYDGINPINYLTDSDIEQGFEVVKEPHYIYGASDLKITKTIIQRVTKEPSDTSDLIWANFDIRGWLTLESGATIKTSEIQTISPLHSGDQRYTLIIGLKDSNQYVELEESLTLEEAKSRIKQLATAISEQESPILYEGAQDNSYLLPPIKLF